MKRRYLYSILVGVPGIVVSLILTFVLFGFTAGMLWLFVFGDNPWPALNETLLALIFGLVFLIIWLAFLIIGFLIGKRLEQNPALNRTHVLISAGLTVLLLLFIVLSQVSNGNIGPKTAEVRCSEYCSQKGYSASSVSPRVSANRTCSCLDHSGLEIIQVPLESLDSAK
jgi:hypothetical protein